MKFEVGDIVRVRLDCERVEIRNAICTVRSHIQFEKYWLEVNVVTMDSAKTVMIGSQICVDVSWIEPYAPLPTVLSMWCEFNHQQGGTLAGAVLDFKQSNGLKQSAFCTLLAKSELATNPIAVSFYLLYFENR